MRILKERNLWPEHVRRSDGIGFLLQCPKTQTGLGATQALKESLSAVHVVCWQLNRTSRSKKVDYRKSWSAMDSWLSFIPSSTVNLILLSGTGVAASGMPGKIASTA